MCTLFDTPAPPTIDTMRVSGFIKNRPVTILIDSGSFHNFVDIGLVKKLRGHLDIRHTFKKLQMGEWLQNVAQTIVKIQEFSCTTNPYAIPLGDCEVVLGVQWIRALGRILWDFDKVYMQFSKGSWTFCITTPGSSLTQIKDISALQMQKLLLQKSTIGAVLYHMDIEIS